MSDCTNPLGCDGTIKVNGAGVRECNHCGLTPHTTFSHPPRIVLPVTAYGPGDLPWSGGAS